MQVIPKCRIKGSVFKTLIHTGASVSCRALESAGSVAEARGINNYNFHSYKRFIHKLCKRFLCGFKYGARERQA